MLTLIKHISSNCNSYKMSKVLSALLILFSLISMQLHAVKAYPYPITVTQPDGSTLVIRLGGDEHFKYQTTDDGILIQQDASGFYNYAAIENNNIVIKNLKAKNKNERTNEDLQLIETLHTANLSKKISTLSTLKTRQKSASSFKISQANSFPTKGTVRSLVILVNFSDKNFVVSTPKTQFSNLLNQEGYSQNGGTGSASDYFMASSMGQFTPQFDVVGPYTLPNTLEFYGKNNSSDDDENPQQMVIDACAKADADGVNFANYDLDNEGKGNGVVDNIFIYYAGHNEAEGAAKNTVWPHRWSLNDASTKFDGKIIYDYACTSELRGSSGTSMCGIGTFSHEFGHVLGLVDYYHTTADKNTLESWSIMDGGAYNNSGRTPPLYSSYDRFALGWLTPTQLTTPVNIRLKPLASSNKAFLISQSDTHNFDGANPQPKEFFLIENRIKAGFDSFLPGSGLLIWHIDYNQTAWDDNSPNNYTGSNQTSESHMRVYLQPLVGNTTTPGSAFTTGSFQPTLWNGALLDKTISQISLDKQDITNQDITFKYRGGSTAFLPPVATLATEVTNSSLIANWEEANNAKHYLLTAYYTIPGSSYETESFDNGLELPSGWQTTITNTTILGSQTNKALLFKFNGEALSTTSYPETVTEFSFLIKTIDSNTGNLKLEGHNGIAWETIDNIVVPGFTSETKSFKITKNYKQFKLTNTGANATIAIDDVKASYGVKLNYHYKDKEVLSTSETLTKLVPDMNYCYLVKAVDDYGFQTAFSNKITTKLLAYNNAVKLRIDMYSNGDTFVFPENLSDPIYIYNIAGQLIASFKPTDFKVNIKAYLRKNTVYILKAGNRTNKILY